MAVFSCLSYPGSKRKVVDEINANLPDGIKDWREPFFGGGSVTISFLQNIKSKDCERFIVGDLYPEIWAFWKGIQQNPKEVEAWIREYWKKVPKHDIALEAMGTEDYDKLYLSAIEEGLEFWKWTQSVDTKQMNLYQRAARFFIVNQISFSSMSDSGSLSKDGFMGFHLGRVNKIFEVSPLLQRVEILNAPFQTTMADVTKDSFVFLDPPYIAQESSGLYGKKGSTHHGFPHLELAELCKSLPCNWLMTIDDSIKARKLYDGCEIVKFHIPYTMAGKTAEDALAGEEIFISNYSFKNDEDDFGSLDDMI